MNSQQIYETSHMISNAVMKTSTYGQSRWEFLYLIVSIVIVLLHVRRSMTKLRQTQKTLLKSANKLKPNMGFRLPTSE